VASATVRVEGVLGAVPAAGHALAALDASGALGTGAAEERVGDRPARLLDTVPAEEHPDRRETEGVPPAELLGQPLHLDVGRGHRRIGNDAQHPLGWA
jgi:hypothetical protein